MRSIVRHVGDRVDSESCSIVLAEPELGHCFVVASKGHPEVDMLELDLAKYPEIREAIDTKSPVVIQDVATHPLMSGVRQQLMKLDFNSIMVVPLTFGEDVLGTIVKEYGDSVEFQRQGGKKKESVDRSKITDVERRGRPVLVGTVSIEKSERLAGLLDRRGGHNS